MPAVYIRYVRHAVLLASLAGCRIDFDPLALTRDGGPSSSDAGDALVADAMPPTGPFGSAAPITEINLGGPADDVTLTGDLTEMYFNSNRAPNAGGEDIWVATQNNIGDWTMLAPVTPLNTGGDDATPEVMRDGLTMYFVTGGSSGMKDVFLATRADRASPWGGKTEIFELSTPADESGPTLTPDGLTMYLSTNANGDDDLFVSTRSSTTSPWETPTPVTGINTAANDAEPFINGSNTLLLFASDRDGNYDLFMARRARATDPWGAPVALGELNTSGTERDPWLSPDERTLFFARDNALFTASR